MLAIFLRTRTLTVLLSNSPLSANPDSGSTPPSPILQSCPIPKIIAAPLVLRMSAAKVKAFVLNSVIEPEEKKKELVHDDFWSSLIWVFDFC